MQASRLWQLSRRTGSLYPDGNVGTDPICVCSKKNPADDLSQNFNEVLYDLQPQKKNEYITNLHRLQYLCHKEKIHFDRTDQCDQTILRYIHCVFEDPHRDLSTF